MAVYNQHNAQGGVGVVVGGGTGRGAGGWLGTGGIAERHLQVAALIDMNTDVLSVTMATAAGGIQDAAPARFLFNSRLMSRRRYIFFSIIYFFFFFTWRRRWQTTQIWKKKNHRWSQQGAPPLHFHNSLRAQRLKRSCALAARYTLPICITRYALPLLRHRST